MAEARKMDSELVAKHEDYFRGLIVSCLPPRPVEDHPLRPWQEMLLEKLGEPPNDREAIFVVNKKGDCGKSWFTRVYPKKYGKSETVTADKRADMSYELINKCIENGPPKVIFIDASRARAPYISSPFIEDGKNGIIASPKYKSKAYPLPEVPHICAMTNEFPTKTVNDKGLSDDRYVYLVIGDDGLNGEWMYGYHDEGLTTTSDFNNPLTPYNVIQRVWGQSSLPDGLQVGINKQAYKYYGDNHDPEVLQHNIYNAIDKWDKKKRARSN
jgi:hypothetical protein